MAAAPLRLNLGCGRGVIAGWVNIDARPGAGVDLVADLDRVRDRPLPFPDGTVSEFLLSHLIEHLADPLALMEELHRVALPGAVAEISVPYGASDDAWTDPTHRRPYFIGSFGYFSQPLYWRADYGYQGDWKPERVHLLIDPAFRDETPPAIMRRVHRERNIVREMIARLVAVKPARPQDRRHATVPAITLEFAPDA